MTNNTFHQTDAEKQAAKLAADSLKTCQIVDGDAYFWAMFSLLVIAAFCALVYIFLKKRGRKTEGVPLEESEEEGPTAFVQTVNPMNWRLKQWMVAIGGLASVAVVAMYFPIIDCRSKRLV